jgi:short-subunit dehydrogenase
MMQFKNKWVLITGASSGLGKVFAQKLSAAGAKLVLVARNEEALKEIASLLKHEHNTESIIVIKDLSKPNSAQEVFNEVKNTGIIIDILINDAGFGAYGHFHTTDLNRNEQMLMVNIIALTELTHLFLPDMVSKKSGIIINISSLAAFFPIQNFAVYCGTKAYVRLFTEILWQEYRNEGVQFLCVCPGSTDTDFFINAKMKPSQPTLASPSKVVDQALKALEKNKIYVVCGPVKNKILSQLRRFFTRKFLSKIVKAKTKRR